MKKETSGATLMKTKNSRAGANVHEKKSSGIGAVKFLRRLRSPEIIHIVAGHMEDPE